MYKNVVLKRHSNGFSLIELMVVFAVISILTAIAVPLFKFDKNQVEKVVCDTNCLQLEKMYRARLILENTNHSEARFLQYLQGYGQDICPVGSDIIYQGGKVKCIVHSVDDGSEGDSGDSGDVPFL